MHTDWWVWLVQWGCLCEHIPVHTHKSSSTVAWAATELFLLEKKGLVTEHAIFPAFSCHPKAGTLALWAHFSSPLHQGLELLVMTTVCVIGPKLSHVWPRKIRLQMGGYAGDELKITGLVCLFLLLNLRVTSILSPHSCEWCLCHQTRDVCLQMEGQKLGLHNGMLNMEGVWPQWSNTAETLLCFSVLAPCSIAHVCPLPGTEAGWGALCHASLHMKATALDASPLNWLNFRQKFAPLIKTCFTEHWVWPQKDIQAACFWVTRLQIQAFPLWKKSFEMACCSFQSALVMGSRQHVTRDPKPIKGVKEQSSPSLQNIQRNIYSTFATNAAKVLKERGKERTWNTGNRPNRKTREGKWGF